jgi:two-component system, OmpR family, sensor histidine kinase KdpD
MVAPRKPTPDELLRMVEAEHARGVRGRLKIFLGYASGVGKSFRMLDEGRRRKARGEDVVVAAVQPDASPEVAALLEGFEVIAPQAGLASPCIDVEALRRRRPAVCLIDGLAYHNPPGGKHAERWQDVEELLEAGISVITTINLQYVRERQTQVERIRGKRVNDSVPESFLRQADEIEVVDAAAEHRAGGLLREIALLLAAEVVDAQLDEYLRRHGVEQSYGTHERVLVCLTPRSNAALMLARGRRQADRFHGELFAAYFEHGDLPAAERAALEKKLEEARAVRAEVVILRGADFVGSILDYAQQHGITQIYVGHSQRQGFWQRFASNPVERLIAESVGIDVRVFPHGAVPRE